MKLNNEIINRVRQYEEKRGISYAKAEGKLFSSLKIIYTILFAYTMAINLLFILGWALMSGTESFKYITDSLYTIIACTGITIVGFVLICTKLKFWGNVISIFPLVFSVLIFARLLEDATIRFGYKISFYWRHLGPIAVMVLLLIFMSAIIIREKICFNKNYKKVINVIYEEYMSIPKEEQEISWEEYLKNYCEEHNK